MNRALARRSFFETDADIRFFLSRLIKAVRRGQIELHAWTVLTTHFHLLVRSPAGQLSEALRFVQSDYVRFFNRMRGRDGPLVRGRFLSKPVKSLFYRRVLLRYIDGNAVDAGLAAHPAGYRWCSARHYVAGDGPRWLTRSWVETEVAERARRARFDPRDYPGFAGGDAHRALEELVLERLACGRDEDRMDSLIDMAGAGVRKWLLANAALADGTPEDLPYVGPGSAMRAVERMAAERGPWCGALGSPVDLDVWDAVKAGVLRGLAGQRIADIARRMRCGESRVRRLLRKDREAVLTIPHYLDMVADLTERLLAGVRGASAACER